LGGILNFLAFLGYFRNIVTWRFWATSTLSIGGTPTYLSGNPAMISQDKRL